MSTILKGLAIQRQEPDSWGFYAGHTNPTGFDLPAVLIIGKEGAEPRVFSEDEVRRMFIKLTAGIDAGSRIGLHLQSVAAEYGIKI